MPFLQVMNLEEYYGLAIELANKAHKRLLSAGVYEIERQELIQEGFRGLVEAGNRYDPPNTSLRSVVILISEDLRHIIKTCL